MTMRWSSLGTLPRLCPRRHRCWPSRRTAQSLTCVALWWVVFGVRLSGHQVPAGRGIRGAGVPRPCAGVGDPLVRPVRAQADAEGLQDHAAGHQAHQHLRQDHGGAWRWAGSGGCSGVVARRRHARLWDCACRRLPSRLDADCAACVCNGVWAGGWLQFLRLAPAGSSEMHNNLTTGAITLYQGGSQNIFTPMYFFVARKPATAAASSRK